MKLRAIIWQNAKFTQGQFNQLEQALSDAYMKTPAEFKDGTIYVRISRDRNYDGDDACLPDEFEQFNGFIIGYLHCMTRCHLHREDWEQPQGDAT